MSLSYQISKPLRDLPPTDFKVKEIRTNPTNFNLPRDILALAVSVEIINRDATSCTVKINDETPFTIGAGSSQLIENATIYSIEVSGITLGEILLQVFALTDLKRLGAIELC